MNKRKLTLYIFLVILFLLTVVTIFLLIKPNNTIPPYTDTYIVDIETQQTTELSKNESYKQQILLGNLDRFQDNFYTHFTEYVSKRDEKFQFSNAFIEIIKSSLKQLDFSFQNTSGIKGEFITVENCAAEELNYSFTRGYQSFADYPSGDTLKSITHSLKFYSGTDILMKNHIFTFYAPRGTEIKFTERDNFLLQSFIPYVSLDSINLALNNANTYLKSNLQYASETLYEDSNTSVIMTYFAKNSGVHSNNLTISITTTGYI